MSRPVVVTWLAVLLISLALPAQAAWDRYVSSAANGPPNDDITAIAQGVRGEIGVGTARGPSIFDGDRWQLLGGGIETNVMSLLQDSRGVWWIGAASTGLWQVDGDSVSNRRDIPELPNSQINVLFEDHRGDVWVGMPDRLARFRRASGTWELIPLHSTGLTGLTSFTVNTVFEDHLHRLWVGTREGVTVADSTRTGWIPFSSVNSAIARDSVFAFGEDRDGGIWAGAYGGWAYRLPPGGGAWQQFSAQDGLPPTGNIRSIVRDSTGSMWFATFSTFGDDTAPGTRLARYDGRSFRPVSGPGGAALFGEIEALLVDDPGNLWVATRRNGLYRYNGVGNEQFLTLRSPTQACDVPSFRDPDAHVDELPGNCLSAMLEDHTHSWWFATQDGGAARLAADGSWSQMRLQGGLVPEDGLTALIEDRSANLWVGTSASGVTRITPARDGSVTFGTASGLVDASVVSLFEDAAGSIWDGTANGLSMYDGTSWRTMLSSATPGASSPVLIQKMVEDTTRTLWLLAGEGFLKQLWSIDPTRTQARRYRLADGLPDDGVISLARVGDGTIWVGSVRGIAHRMAGAWDVVPATVHGVGAATALYEDHDGRFWVGGNGVSYLLAGSWHTQSGAVTGQRDPSQILEDRSGRMWFCGPGGVAYSNGSEWREYTQSSGLIAPSIDELREDSHGRIWARGPGGLTLITPDHTAPQTVFRLPPPTISTARNVTFSFAAAYLESADLEFEVTADGVTRPSWTTATSFTMSGLGDGTHTFSVRARDWSRNADPTPADVAFVVDATPPPATISSPVFRQGLQGAFAIEGSTGRADRDRYSSHRIEVRRVGTEAWTALDSTVRAVASVDTLFTWDTRPVADPGRYPDGDYELRLSVQDSLGLVGTALVTVVVDNVAPFAVVTSPVLIQAARGGDVFTTDTEVHVYVPPLALSSDATVSIDAASSGTLPATLPDGGTRVGGGWAIDWPGATLTQPGVLEMRVPAGESRALAIYKEESGNSWTRLGGAATSPGAPLSVALSSPGRFALFTGGTPLVGGGLSGLSLAPRAFSPQGGFGSRDVAIGFTLGRPGSVSVKVFNRAGRMLRLVADGVGMPSGSGVVHWDGRDRDGRVVEEGLYIVTVEALGERSMQTLAVLK